jgi:hypothetical protein
MTGKSGGKTSPETYKMKAFYQITAKEIGTISIRRRKIAKALRWWLREHGYTYTNTIIYH